MHTGNTQHPVSVALESQWHKLLAILMLRDYDGSVDISSADVSRAIEEPGGINITAREVDGAIQLRLVSDAEAERLVETEGGRVDGN